MKFFDKFRIIGLTLAIVSIALMFLLGYFNQTMFSDNYSNLLVEAAFGILVIMLCISYILLDHHSWLKLGNKHPNAKGDNRKKNG